MLPLDVTMTERLLESYSWQWRTAAAENDKYGIVINYKHDELYLKYYQHKVTKMYLNGSNVTAASYIRTATMLG